MAPHQRWDGSCRTRLSYVSIAPGPWERPSEVRRGPRRHGKPNSLAPCAAGGRTEDTPPSSGLRFPGGGWLPGVGWGAVASDDLAVGALDLAGAVGVGGEGPAEFVQDDVVVPPAVVLEVGEAGPAAVLAVGDVVGFAAGGGLVAAAGGLGRLVPQGGPAAPARGLRSRWRRRNEAAPPGPETTCRILPRIWCSIAASAAALASPAGMAVLASGASWAVVGSGAGWVRSWWYSTHRAIRSSTGPGSMSPV